MENIVFEDIRVEMQTDNLPPVIQRSDDHQYDGKGGGHFPLLIRVDNTHYGKDKVEPWGRVKNCTFRDIAVYAEHGVPNPGIDVTAHVKTENGANPFENIVFERFSINGKIVDWSEFSFKTNAPVRLRDEK